MNARREKNKSIDKKMSNREAVTEEGEGQNFLRQQEDSCRPVRDRARREGRLKQAKVNSESEDNNARESNDNSEMGRSEDKGF